MMEILSVILDTKYVMHRLEKSNIPILVIPMLEYCRNHNFLRVAKAFQNLLINITFLITLL